MSRRLAFRVFLVAMAARLVLGATTPLKGLVHLGVALAIAAAVTTSLAVIWLRPAIRRNRELALADGTWLVRTGIRVEATERACAQIRPDLGSGIGGHLLDSTAYSVTFADDGLALVHGPRPYHRLIAVAWAEVTDVRIAFVIAAGRRMRCIEFEIGSRTVLPVVFGRERLGGAFPLSRSDAQSLVQRVQEHIGPRGSAQERRRRA